MLVVNLDQARIIRTPYGSEIKPLIDRTTSRISHCSLAEETLPAGCRVSLHHHEVLEEIYYVVSGRGLMRVNDEEREVVAGDAIFIPRRSLHTLINTSTQPMKIILVCGPAYSPEDHSPPRESGEGIDA